MMSSSRTTTALKLGFWFLKSEPKVFLRDWVQENYRFVAYRPRIQTVDLFDLYPDARAELIPLEAHPNYWNVSLHELYLLSCLARAIQAKNIFEIGTYDGATSLQLARACPEATIWTIDLPAEQCQSSGFTPGERFHGLPEAEHIRQLVGSSLTFDFSPYEGKQDLVFVDASHKYENVKQDSQTALRLVRPGGVIVWDDYLTWPGVKRAIEELLPRYPIQHLDSTKFAMLLNAV
jgi:predicted O-methyltransferase YrrM